MRENNFLNTFANRLGKICFEIYYDAGNHIA